jgi:rare lipoprotein A
VKVKYACVAAITAALAFGAPGTLQAKDSKRHHHHQAGIASVYSTGSGSGTASGQRLNPRALTAAHRSLPFGTKVRVTNKRNGRTVVVTINDRGPFVRGRVIDLTPAGARAIGMGWGLAPVELDVIG